MDEYLYRIRCALPLDLKIRISKRRIIDWVEHYGIDSVYASFSGGVGSTCLYFLLQEIAQEQGWDKNGRGFVRCLFINTRNEYPQVVNHVYALKGQHNAKYRKIMGNRTYNIPGNHTDCIDVRIPKKFIRDVISEKGFLIVSKKISRCISDIRKSKGSMEPKDIQRVEKLLDIKNKYSVSKRCQYLIDSPIKISHKCCDIIKKSVFREYSKETGKYYPITGEQACESRFRADNYLKYGCNGYTRKKPKCTPLAFWTSSDMLEFLKIRDLPYPECYGDIIEKNGIYKTTGEKRTGCMCCFAGILEEEHYNENRFQRMEREYPIQHKLMFSPVEDGGFGADQVAKVMHIPIHAKVDYSFDELVEMFNLI